MRTRIFIYLSILLGVGVLSGCASTLDRVRAVQPDGGASRVFSRDFDLVFPAALRVMHQNKENIEEASPATGRIVSLQPFGSRGVFVTKLPGDRTRVELSASMYLWPAGPFSLGAEAFFARLREQIAIFEKKKIQEALSNRKIQVDQDLKTIFNPNSEEKKPPPPEPAPAAKPSRRDRLRFLK